MRRELNMTDSYLYDEWAEEEFSTPGVPEPKPLSPGPEDWVVGGTEVRENEVIILTGNLIVEPGGNLTLINCTLLMKSRIKVDSSGILNVLEGSNITAYDPEYPLFFCVDGRLIMRDSFLSICDRLYLTTTEGVELYNTTISNNVLGIHCVESSNISIVNCTINNNVVGVECYESSNISIVGCTISNNKRCGIYCEYSYGISIANCTIKQNGDGIICGNSKASVHYCDIYSNRGLGLRSYGRVNATYCWWGSPNGPEYKEEGDPYDPEEVYGYDNPECLIYEPWLTKPFGAKPTPPTEKPSPAPSPIRVLTHINREIITILGGIPLVGDVIMFLEALVPGYGALTFMIVSSLTMISSIAVPVRYWKAERSRSEKLLKLVKRKRQYRFGIDYLVSKTGLDERKVERLLTKLLKNGQLTGILDRKAGTFIYIPRHKIEAIFRLIESRGVVSLRELANKFNLTERELELLITSMRGD